MASDDYQIVICPRGASPEQIEETAGLLQATGAFDDEAQVPERAAQALALAYSPAGDLVAVLTGEARHVEQFHSRLWVISVFVHPDHRQSSLAPTLAGAATPTPPRPAMSTFEPGVQAALESALRQFDSQAGAAADERSLGAAWGEVGMVYQAHHLQGLARDCYEQAVVHAPDSFRWRYLLGYLYQETGAYDRALTAYDRALALDPEYSSAQLRRGQVYLALEDYSPAAADFEAVLAARPGQAARFGLNEAAGLIV